MWIEWANFQSNSVEFFLASGCQLAGALDDALRGEVWDRCKKGEAEVARFSCDTVLDHLKPLGFGLRVD